MTTELTAVVVTMLFTIATSVPIGLYMARVFSGQRTSLDVVFLPIERLVLKVTGVDAGYSQNWKEYSRSLLISNVVMWLACFALLSLQHVLPLNPDGIAAMEPSLSFNTASSFTTNTNLQHYSGETGLSYLSQMIVITFLQFVTAATGMAALVAIIRALGGNQLTKLGHFYVDMTRASVRVLLPLALLVGTIAISQGTPMTFAGAAKATTLEGQEQTSQEASRRRRWPSNNSGPTVVATSVPIPRTRSRIRRPCRTSCRRGRSPSFRWAWYGRSAR